MALILLASVLARNVEEAFESKTTQQTQTVHTHTDPLFSLPPAAPSAGAATSLPEEQIAVKR